MQLILLSLAASTAVALLNESQAMSLVSVPSKPKTCRCGISETSKSQKEFVFAAGDDCNDQLPTVLRCHAGASLPNRGMLGPDNVISATLKKRRRAKCRRRCPLCITGLGPFSRIGAQVAEMGSGPHGFLERSCLMQSSRLPIRRSKIGAGCRSRTMGVRAHRGFKQDPKPANMFNSLEKTHASEPAILMQCQ